MPLLRRVTIARCPGGHAFVVTQGCRKYCSQACADQFGLPRTVHFQHPAYPAGREACGSWANFDPPMTTVPADVGCGNCKRTDVWKKAMAD
jgi:hypothetical protein